MDHPGVAITVSAGDAGYGAEYPAASKYVTSVGGTALSSSANSRGWTETVWKTSGTNGSCSTTYLCTARTGYDGPTGLGTPEGATAFTG